MFCKKRTGCFLNLIATEYRAELVVSINLQRHIPLLRNLNMCLICAADGKSIHFPDGFVLILPMADPGFPVWGIDLIGSYVLKILHVETKESRPLGDMSWARPLDLPMPSAVTW